MSGIGSIGSGVGSIASGIGDIFAGQGYADAAKIAGQNASLAKLSAGIQLQQEQRQAYRVIGGQKADVAGSGLAESGTALNLLRSSTQQAGLQRGLVALQGKIDVNSWLEKQSADSAQSAAMDAQGAGSIASGVLGIIGI